MVGHNRTAVDPVRAAPLGVDGWHCSTRALALLLVPTANRSTGGSHAAQCVCAWGLLCVGCVCTSPSHTTGPDPRRPGASAGTGNFQFLTLSFF